MDMQNREGGKTGGGGVLSSAQQGIERKERLRQLALETIDLAKDPYFMRNHLGSYECKLCMSIHGNEGSYLAHTQGKRHQTNLAKRAAQDAKGTQKEAAAAAMAAATQAQAQAQAQALQRSRDIVCIGKPGYVGLLLLPLPFYASISLFVHVSLSYTFTLTPHSLHFTPLHSLTHCPLLLPL